MSNYLKSKKAASGFEPEITVLQTAALPLGYAATTIKKKRAMGFEPTTFALARRHSTTELHPLNAHFFYTKLYLSQVLITMPLNTNKTIFNYNFLSTVSLNHDASSLYG